MQPLDSLQDVKKHLDSIAKSVEVLEDGLQRTRVVTASSVTIVDAPSASRGAVPITEVNKTKIKTNWYILTQLYLAKSATRKVISVLSIKFRGSRVARKLTAEAFEVRKKINSLIREAYKVSNKFIAKTFPTDTLKDIIAKASNEVSLWFDVKQGYNRKPRIRVVPTMSATNNQLLLITFLTFPKVPLGTGVTSDITVVITQWMDDAGIPKYYINLTDVPKLGAEIVLGYPLTNLQVIPDLLDTLIPEIKEVKKVNTERYKLHKAKLDGELPFRVLSKSFDVRDRKVSISVPIPENYTHQGVEDRALTIHKILSECSVGCKVSYKVSTVTYRKAYALRCDFYFAGEVKSNPFNFNKLKTALRFKEDHIKKFKQVIGL